jgi:hypothetical protein
MPNIDTEWQDIWLACEYSGLVTWREWIEGGEHEWRIVGFPGDDG